MRLYGYWRSSAAYRVRIALNLKGLAYDTVPVNLLAGEQQGDAYRTLNPAGLIPTLELDDGTRLTQSLAIIEWLDEVHPTPALLPSEPVARARVRAAALTIAADIHPLANLRVLRRLKAQFGAEEEARNDWSRHWVSAGLAAPEVQASGSTTCLFGDEPSLADVLLAPQMYNARRIGLDLAPYPRLVAVDAHCRTLSAFAAAMPEAQPDAAV